MNCDVLIIGGGPAGSSLGALLRKYNPALDILIIERETFPRDHIGESQLPAICKVLDEIGVWDKVEAAGFPVKIGSTYRWGRTDDLWQVNFLHEEIRDIPRPSKYEDQRVRTAFQVDRGIYDKILLDHAESLGCNVRQNVKAVEVLREADRVIGVKVVPANRPEFGVDAPTPELITARYYVDASGGSGVLRRAMDVPVDCPTSLRNIAMWDYWQGADWAEHVGKSGTRAQIMSIGWGWLWFIAIGNTRTSIGLVTPASYLKECGKKPEELYLEAVAACPRISGLVVNAQREGQFTATKDWSYIAERLTGENWFLVGDACGFADPILTAGMTLASVGARKVAYTILELEREEVDPAWVKSEYTRTHKANIFQHIKFAEFWYSSNGIFTDLQEYCQQIATEAGLDLRPEQAFQWLGTGGFATDTLAEEEANLFGFRAAKVIASRFVGVPMSWELSKKNKFKMNLVGASKDTMAHYYGGRVEPVKCYRRGQKMLPLFGYAQMVTSALNLESDASTVSRMISRNIKEKPRLFPDPRAAYQKAMDALETLIAEGWVTATIDKKRPFIPVQEAPE